MQVKLYYLPFDGNTARDIRSKIGYDDSFDVTQDKFEAHWEHEADDEILESDVSDALTGIWARWNRGSGAECSTLTTTFCKDCDETFQNPRQEEAHSDLYDDHEIDGHRSLSVGDIVAIDGNAYLCERIGWNKININPEAAIA